MLTKKCIVCGTEYTTIKKTQKYCSWKCRNTSMIGRSNDWAIGNTWGFQKGKQAWNKGLPKVKNAGKDFSKGHTPWNKGKSPSLSTREKISKSLIGRPTGRTGEKSNFWNGGTSREYDKLKNSLEWKVWRRSVFERDNYTCQKCGDKNFKGLGKTIELHPHHIKDRYSFPELQFEVSNGQTLCIKCHRQTDNYGCKARFKTQ